MEELNIDELIDVPTYPKDGRPDFDRTWSKPAAWKQFKDGLGDSVNIRELAVEMEGAAYLHGAGPRWLLSLAMRNFCRMTHAEQEKLIMPDEPHDECGRRNRVTKKA